MNDFISMIYVDGNLIETCIRCLVLFFSFDCLIGFANAIKSIKGVVS